MPDSIAVGSPEVAGNVVVDAAVLRIPALVAKVATVECLGGFDTPLVTVPVGSGLIIEELAIVVNLEG
jgi:hypothetical protein